MYHRRPTTSTPTRAFSRFLLSCLLAALLVPGLPGAVSAQSVGYAAEPGLDYVSWDDDLGLDEGWMWGGAFTFELGPRIRLSPFFMTGEDFDGDPTLVDGLPDAEPLSFDARHIGAALDVDIATGNVTPFLRVGGGVLRLDPDGRDAIERIALSYGGGLRFGVGRAGVRVFAQGTSYRLSTERLYAAGDPDGDEATRSNLVGGARVSIPLSEMPDDPGVGLSGASFPVGLFAGELQFDDAAGLPDQRVAGVRAGITFNSLVSLQGFYWRGVNDDFDGVQDVRGYGLEGRFDLGSGTGVSPFVIAGGGRIDYPDADEVAADDPFAGRDDQTALILGAGLALRLTDRLDVEVAARDYLLDATGDLEDVSDPGELTNNWLFSAGVSLNLGGTTAQGRDRARMSREDAERQRMQARLDSLETRLADARRDSTAPAGNRASAGDTASRGADTRTVTGPDGRVITLPVLEEGAIYIRFGPEGADTRPWPQAGGGQPAGLRLERSELRDIILDELDRGAAADSADTLDVTELERRIVDRLERRGLVQEPAARPAPAGEPSTAVAERLDAIEAELMRRLDAIEARQRRVSQTPERSTPTPDVDVPVSTEETAWDRMGRFQSSRTLPFGAVGFSDGDTQGLLGVRFDFGPLSPGSTLRLVPEAAFGFGGDETTLTVMANLQFPFADLGTPRDIQPYLLAGAGFYSPTFLGVNTGVGVEFDLRDADRGDPLRSYVELQGINLFDETRLAFGLSLRR